MESVKRSRQFVYGTLLGTGFILGILAGIIAMNLIVSYKIDRFYEQISHLESIIYDKDIRLQKLEESINHRKYLVKDVNIHLEFEGDQLERLSLEKILKNNLNILIGKEVKAIDSDLFIAIIDKRLINIRGTTYQARMSRLVIAEVVQLWIIIQIM